MSGSFTMSYGQLLGDIQMGSSDGGAQIGRVSGTTTTTTTSDFHRVPYALPCVQSALPECLSVPLTFWLKPFSAS